jgi:pilus assembly protein Flp/PilA
VVVSLVLRFAAEESGATAIEYGLIAAAMGISLILAYSLFGDSLAALFGFVEGKAVNAMDNAGI